MGRPLAAASAAWTVAILAAVAGVLAPGNQLLLSLGLFAFALAVGLLVAIVLVVDGLRQRGQRRSAAPASQSPLGRLEYLPSVTTRTRRIRWRGARAQVSSRRGRQAEPRRPAPASASPQQRAPQSNGEIVMGSPYPRPASTTTPPRIDEVEASRRAS